MWIIPSFIIAIIIGTLLLGSLYTAVQKLVSGEFHIKDRIRNKLRASDSFMKWLYSDEKSLSEQISEEFCNAQVSFIRTDWRN